MIDLLIGAGLTAILMYGKPTRPIRDFFDRALGIGEMFSCALCTGFWSGVIVSSVQLWMGNDVPPLFPFAVSAFAWFFDTLIKLMQSCEQRIG